MDITGHDSLLVSPTSRRALEARILEAVLSIWPRVVFSVCRETNTFLDATQLASLDQHEFLLWFRDEETERRFEQEGYFLDRDGTGPFGTTSKVVQSAVLDVRVCDDRTPNLKSPPATGYDATIAASSIWVHTLVTPTVPQDHEFCKWIWDTAVDACT